MTKRGFIKNEEGMYRVRGLVKPEEVVLMASNILFDQLADKEQLTKPTDAARFLQLRLSGEKNEVFGCLFLDNRHRIIEFDEIFRGTVDGAAVYPRVVVQRSLEVNAAAVILSHNHPSGDASPSEADRAITLRLREALSLVDVRVLDHIVVGFEGWVSLAERGWL